MHWNQLWTVHCYSPLFVDCALRTFWQISPASTSSMLLQHGLICTLQIIIIVIILIFINVITIIFLLSWCLFRYIGILSQHTPFRQNLLEKKWFKYLFNTPFPHIFQSFWYKVLSWEDTQIFRFQCTVNYVGHIRAFLLRRRNLDNPCFCASPPPHSTPPPQHGLLLAKKCHFLIFCNNI